MQILTELLNILEEKKKKPAKVSKKIRHKVYHADYLRTKNKSYRKYDPETRD